MTRRRAVRGFLFALAVMLAAGVPVRAQDADGQIRSLVRSLGYGAGIHQFKNYVLRGTDEYRVNAEVHFGQAEKALVALRDSTGLTTDQKQAVDAIARVVSKYLANLGVAQKMIREGRSVTDIDRAVRVDDTPAANGLATLRAGRTWTSLDGLEAALGYAGAIHHFKNYVLRGDDEYRAKAAAEFQNVTRAVAALRVEGSRTARQMQALDDLGGVVRRYAANLEVVRTMIGERKSVKDIDLAVKVDDTPATAALAVLRR
ncbi:MAG: hypothetical protein OEW19_02885 [Acidobacteriota bacterium]|nr:hypothetical protein [Acidobacteriota bacterium]